MHSKTVIFEMKDQFLDYVAACEDVHNPIVVPIISTVQEVYIYSEYESAIPAVISEQQTNTHINDRVAQEFFTFWAAVKASGKVTDVLEWYQEIKLQFTMLAWFATVIFSIPTSQAKNEKGFYLAGIFIGSKRASMLVYMLSKLIFVDRNSICIQHNHTTDVFQVPVENLNKVTEEMEEDLEAEADYDNDE